MNKDQIADIIASFNTIKIETDRIKQIIRQSEFCDDSIDLDTISHNLFMDLAIFYVNVEDELARCEDSVNTARAIQDQPFNFEFVRKAAGYA